MRPTVSLYVYKTQTEPPLDVGPSMVSVDGNLRSRVRPTDAGECVVHWYPFRDGTESDTKRWCSSPIRRWVSWVVSFRAPSTSVTDDLEYGNLTPQ